MALCIFEILMTFETVASALCCEGFESFWKLILTDLVLHADLFDPDRACFELFDVLVYVIFWISVFCRSVSRMCACSRRR